MYVGSYFARGDDSMPQMMALRRQPSAESLEGIGKSAKVSRGDHRQTMLESDISAFVSYASRAVGTPQHLPKPPATARVTARPSGSPPLCSSQTPRVGQLPKVAVLSESLSPRCMSAIKNRIRLGRRIGPNGKLKTDLSGSTAPCDVVFFCKNHAAYSRGVEYKRMRFANSRGVLHAIEQQDDFIAKRECQAACGARRAKKIQNELAQSAAAPQFSSWFLRHYAQSTARNDETPREAFLGSHAPHSFDHPLYYCSSDDDEPQPKSDAAGDESKEVKKKSDAQKQNEMPCLLCNIVLAELNDFDARAAKPSFAKKKKEKKRAEVVQRGSIAPQPKQQAIMILKQPLGNLSSSILPWLRAFQQLNSFVERCMSPNCHSGLYYAVSTFEPQLLMSESARFRGSTCMTLIEYFSMFTQRDPNTGAQYVCFCPAGIHTKDDGKFRSTYPAQHHRGAAISDDFARQAKAALEMLSDTEYSAVTEWEPLFRMYDVGLNEGTASGVVYRPLLLMNLCLAALCSANSWEVFVPLKRRELVKSFPGTRKRREIVQFEKFMICIHWAITVVRRYSNLAPSNDKLSFSEFFALRDLLVRELRRYFEIPHDGHSLPACRVGHMGQHDDRFSSQACVELIEKLTCLGNEQVQQGAWVPCRDVESLLLAATVDATI